jgi:hypothetical protein
MKKVFVNDIGVGTKIKIQEKFLDYILEDEILDEGLTWRVISVVENYNSSLPELYSPLKIFELCLDGGKKEIEITITATNQALLNDCVLFENPFYIDEKNIDLPKINSNRATCYVCENKLDILTINCRICHNCEK